MVWGLFPIDPLPGEQEYYIFRKGTYKVGRKGCDIIINKDKGVSRIHAEIIIDEMICMDHLQKKTSVNSSKVRIRDCSKYGTFINKTRGSKEKVHEFPNKETTLKDGDLVSFGTGNATYRFAFVSLLLFSCSSKPSELNQLQEKISLIGGDVGDVCRTWNLQCTHVVLDDFIPMNDLIVDAIVAKKPLVKSSWIELIAGNTICTDIPSPLMHSPTLTLEGVSLKVTDPQSREQCLKGYTFLLESVYKYKFKEKLPLLLDVGGAKVVDVETLDPNSQSTGDNIVCVMPTGSASRPEIFQKFSSLPKVKEMELISAVVSGHLNPSIMTSAPVLITSSCSTDETVVADSDIEMETATSTYKSVAVNLIESAEDEGERTVIQEVEFSGNGCKLENVIHIRDSMEYESGGSKAAVETIEHKSQGLVSPSCGTIKPDSSYSTAVKSDCIYISSPKEKDDCIVVRKDKGHSADSENLDIMYSQNLIVRQSNLSQSGQTTIDGPTVNFKRFRKIPSGNSFSNLIPFSKYPYEESDYGNEDVAESVKEEKKRKQMEAIAEDLFNNEKGRRRGAAGQIHGLLTRR